MPYRDLTDVTLVSEEHVPDEHYDCDDPDYHDDLTIMIMMPVMKTKTKIIKMVKIKIMKAIMVKEVMTCDVSPVAIF